MLFPHCGLGARKCTADIGHNFKFKHTNLFDRVHVGSCFLFVGQHALCLQGVESDCATSWTVARWCEEVQVVAEESGNLQQNVMWCLISFRLSPPSLAWETLIIIYISQNSAFLFSFKLTGVFTAERWLHRQVSGMINVWATEPFRLQRRSHSQCSSPHTLCASVLFNAATHRTVPPIGGHISANGSLDSQREIIYPSSLTGDQLYKLWFGQYLWTFNRCTPESCRSTVSHYWQITSAIQLQWKLIATHQLSFYALQKTNTTCCLDIRSRRYTPNCYLPPVGCTLPVLLVREPKDPSRHSEVVQSFWVMVGSSCSKPAFWL